MAISKKFFVDIDLQGNGLNNATVGANADMTKAGSFQYNTETNRLEYYNGSIVETVANLNDLTGALDFQGGYDADTNTPNLTTPAEGAVLKGYYYVVTVAGTFFGEQLNIGDSLFANIDNPAALSDWTLVQGNLNLATEEVAGITYLASAAQVATGTATGAYAVNPATLQGKIDAQSYTAVIATGDWSGTTGNYSYYVTHNLLKPYVFTAIDNDSGEIAEVVCTRDTAVSSYIYVNNIPTGNLLVSFVKAGGNL